MVCGSDATIYIWAFFLNTLCWMYFIVGFVLNYYMVDSTLLVLYWNSIEKENYDLLLNYFLWKITIMRFLHSIVKVTSFYNPMLLELAIGNCQLFFCDNIFFSIFKYYVFFKWQQTMPTLPFVDAYWLWWQMQTLKFFFRVEMYFVLASGIVMTKFKWIKLFSLYF